MKHEIYICSFLIVLYYFVTGATRGEVQCLPYARFSKLKHKIYRLYIESFQTSASAPLAMFAEPSNHLSLMESLFS